MTVSPDAEYMERIEIERIPHDQRAAIQVLDIKNGRKKKRVGVPSVAVRITVYGVDGSEITDVWTRDRFWTFFRMANQVIADD